MRRLYRFAGFILVIAAVIYFILYLVKNWALLSANIFELKTIPTLITTTIFYLSCFLLTSKAWYNLLYYFGETPKFLSVLTTILLSQFAKYIPGNFAHHVSRIVLAKNEGFANSSVAITMLVELVLVILSAGSSAIIAISFDKSIHLSKIIEIPTPGIMSALSLIVLLVIYIFYLSLPSLKNTFRKRLKTNEISFSRIYNLLECYLLYMANFLLLGAILYLLTDELFTQVQPGYWLLTGIFSIAWIVGFITPGAPAGLGVREAILIMALDPIYGSAVALSLTVTLRIITTLGDGLGFLIGLSMRKWLKHNSKAQLSIK